MGNRKFNYGQITERNPAINETIMLVIDTVSKLFVSDNICSRIEKHCFRTDIVVYKTEIPARSLKKEI